MPTYPASVDLAEGTGTRSFSAVSTNPGDWLVVECIGSDGNITGFTPTCAGLTFGKQTDNAAGVSDVAIEQWTAPEDPDTGGGSRTVQIAVTGTGSYRAKVTVTRNSSGPGTGKATSLTAQTVSVTRQGTDSGMFYAVGDWSTGAVGSPAWTPGGATTASEQGALATYIFGRWDAAGAPGTASHGISSPAYTTPSIAVLEMLDAPTGGSAPAPSLPPQLLQVLAFRNQAMWQSPPDTAAEIGANADEATGSGLAPDPTVDVAVNAEAATGTGSAPDASAALTIGADVAAGTGFAPDGAASAGISADAATGSGASLDAQAAVATGAEAASGAGAAFDATVSTASIANAPADVATGTGAAPDPSTAVTVNAEAAAGTGTALDASITITVPAGIATGTGAADAPTGGPSGVAGLASGTGAAFDTSIALTISADVAAGTGAAPDPVGSGSSPGQALAQVATGTGAAYDARTRKLILRPFSGTTVRPDTGRTSRPSTGVTLRP